MLELSALESQVIDIAHTTGAYLLSQQANVRQQDVEIKDLNSLVSYVDKTAETQLVNSLQKILPSAVFLTEEATVRREEGDLQWIIDPLDGTTNYLHGLPVFSISIALRHQGTLVLGVVYDPARGECFHATKGNGTFLNGAPIRTSSTVHLADSLLATGFPYFDFDKMPNYLRALSELMTTCRGLRRMGSAAIDLAWTAAGRFDTFFEYNLNTWDVAAGCLLVTEAGGTVSDFSGGHQHESGIEIIAGTPPIHTAVRKVLGQYF